MPETTIKHTYQLKRGKEFTLQRLNPLLRKGEPIVVYCKDGKTNIKIGDGIHNYNDLEFISSDLKLLPPDYKQNDNTQPDYINNRPFYIAGNLETLVENKNIILSETVNKFTQQDKFMELEIGCKYEVDFTIKYKDETYNIDIPEVMCCEVNNMLGTDESIPALVIIHEKIEQAFINEFPEVASLPYQLNPYITIFIFNNFYSVYDDTKSAYNIVLFDNDGNTVTNASHNIETTLTIKKDTRQLILDEDYNKLFEKDFNENDLSSINYIKNRPIYTEYVSTPLQHFYKESADIIQAENKLLMQSNHNLQLVADNEYILYYIDSTGETKQFKVKCVKYDNNTEVLLFNNTDVLGWNNGYFSLETGKFVYKANTCGFASLIDWNTTSIVIEGNPEGSYLRPVYHRLSPNYINVSNKVDATSSKPVTSAGVWKYVEEGNTKLSNWFNVVLTTHDNSDSAHPHLQNNINVLQNKINDIPKLRTGFIVDEANAIVKESNALIESNGGQLITYIPPTDIIDGTLSKYLHVYNETVNKTTYTRVKIILKSMSKFTEDVINHIKTFKYIQLRFKNETNIYYLKFDGIDLSNLSYLSLNFSFIDDNRFTVSTSDDGRVISDLILFNNAAENSHSENSSDALGKDSHAEGTGTIAKGESQHTQGKFNVIDEENKYAHIVGNGTDDEHRSNAYTLDWQGNAEYAGNVKSSDVILRQDDNTEISLKEGLQTLADAIKEVNGIKYIISEININELSNGLYIIDSNAGKVQFNDEVISNIIGQNYINAGSITISPYIDSAYKHIVFSIYNNEGYPIFFDTIYDINLQKCEETLTYVYVCKAYVDKQIAALQAQIDTITTTQTEIVEDYEEASELLGGNEE